MQSAPIRDAVTVVLQHEGDVLMIHRQRALPAFPGHWAFPGGKVDDVDHQAVVRGGAHFAAIEPHVVECLAREVREEVGFDLDMAASAGEVLALHVFGTALTPPIVPVRFNTLFYRLQLRSKPALTIDTGELEGAEWAPAAEWIARYRRGRLLLAPPTLAALDLLASGGGTTPELRDLEKIQDVPLPILESVYGVRQIHVPSHTLPPAEHTNCFLLGDEPGRMLMVDPSPRDESVMESLLARVAPFGVGEVFVTHHHHDHHQLADEIARRLGVPIGMSADTRMRIGRANPRFFDGLTVREHVDGEAVGTWLGQPIRVVAVPGHDEGQLALMPDDRAWCIVGDLIQGIGTVVISKPEGHMGRYFASLQRIIDLDPAVIYPSHGIGMGSTFRLSETLKHRRMREDAVRTMHRAGRTIEEMLDAMYRDVDPRLLPLARRNIEAHLDKLTEEGALG